MQWKTRARYIVGGWPEWVATSNWCPQTHTHQLTQLLHTATNNVCPPKNVPSVPPSLLAHISRTLILQYIYIYMLEPKPKPMTSSSTRRWRQISFGAARHKQLECAVQNRHQPNQGSSRWSRSRRRVADLSDWCGCCCCYCGCWMLCGAPGGWGAARERERQRQNDSKRSAKRLALAWPALDLSHIYILYMTVCPANSSHANIYILSTMRVYYTHISG